MLNKILNFITPGPLDEIIGFGARVFSSWISLGLVLGLFIAIIALLSGEPIDFPTFILVILSMPLSICLLGLIGIGINSIRGRRSEYPGWYWWVFPISTYLWIGLWLGLAYFGFILDMIGITLPKLPDFEGKRQYSKMNRERLRQKLENMNAEDILNEFGKQIEEIEKKNQLNNEEKRVIRKIKGLDRSKLRSQVQVVLDEEELEILFLFLLKLLSGELE